SDHLGRDEEAEVAYRKALSIDSEHWSAEANLNYLLLATAPHQEEGDARYRLLLPRLPTHAADPLRAFYAFTRDNFGEATKAFSAVLDSNQPTLLISFHDDMLRVLRLAAERGYGEKLLAWLDETGLSDRYLPLRAAFDAYLHGERRLQDVNPEVRGAAKRIFDWLDSRRRNRESVSSGGTMTESPPQRGE
ncbi:MAG: ATP-binding protein, partial [Pseudomonadota bacterium]|nr:ATP-binding protein [Pseudomonadota bacterium]